MFKFYAMTDSPKLLLYIPLLTALISVITVMYTIRQGQRTDTAARTAADSLELSQNIRLTFTAQLRLIRELQEEVEIHKTEIDKLRKQVTSLLTENFTLRRQQEAGNGTQP